MYVFVLSLHNILRWLVVLSAILVLVRAYSGWFGKKRWIPSDNRAGAIFTMLLDIQLLVGLILYFFLSPTTMGALSNFGAAMKAPLVRFFAVEHLLMMVVALVIAHLGRALAKKATSDPAKHRAAAIWFTLTVLLILASIPWPFLAAGRPWFRLGGFAF